MKRKYSSKILSNLHQAQYLLYDSYVCAELEYDPNNAKLEALWKAARDLESEYFRLVISTFGEEIEP